MSEYLIKWAIDIDAETPVQAATEALKIMQDRGSEATVFDVWEGDKHIATIDLFEDKVTTHD